VTVQTRDCLTSSAAIVTVWFVAITGTIFAWIKIRWEEVKESDEVRTWLLVIEEKRRIAEGRERKKDWAAASKKFPILDHKKYLS
jgi:hypothetical protein